jgi:fructosamine-3-kinase
MRSILFLILFIAEGWFISISAQDSEQRILEQLDKAISQKEKFKNDREAVISQIKQRLNYATDNTERYKLCGELFNLYLHYQADSATIFVVKNTTTLSSLNRRETSKSLSIGLK